jgi:hypothetical protein
LGGRWVALLATQGNTFNQSAAVWANVYDMQDQLVASAIDFFTPNHLKGIVYDEKKNSQSGKFVWTGVNINNGDLKTGSTCTNWDTGSSSGGIGKTDQMDGNWVDNGSQTCGSNTARLYCISQ